MGLTAVMAAATAYQVYSGERSAGMQQDALGKQEQAQKQATDKASQQTRLSEQAQNAANRKAPDAASILSAATQSTQGGGGAGTMLTGPQGIDPNALALGKNTLLGG
jgi:hypothetical protein